ncbi:MAG: phytanoyl-CoA dioxygenase family protein [Opitutaceae bacterium]|nr:phytanoyl-CoA dioxygenase family protein [Opitutaceae bacterium]
MSAQTELPPLVSYGHALDGDDRKIGRLRSSADVADDMPELRRRLEEDGYLYMKGYLDRDKVLEARRSILSEMAEMDVLDPAFPADDAICKADAATLQFMPEVADRSDSVQSLLYSGRLLDFYRKFYDEPIRHYDFTWLRAMGPGKGTNPHSDLPYMGRGTDRHMTCWFPYGDIPFDLGGLMILEGSHKRMDLLKNYVYRDVDSYCENKPEQKKRADEGGWTFTGTLSHNPPVVRNKFGGRWLTTEFEAGDFLTFGMFMVHAAVDNCSGNQFRISSDSRYQRASEPIDERWVGENPAGHSKAAKNGRVC